MAFHRDGRPRTGRRPAAEPDRVGPVSPTRLDADAEQLLYTPAEAAGLLRVRESWLRRRVAARLVPCTFLGRHLRFSAADLAAIVAQHAQPVGVRRGHRRRRGTTRDGSDLMSGPVASVDASDPMTTHRGMGAAHGLGRTARRRLSGPPPPARRHRRHRLHPPDPTRRPATRQRDRRRTGPGHLPRPPRRADHPDRLGADLAGHPPGRAGNPVGLPQPPAPAHPAPPGPPTPDRRSAASTSRPWSST